MLIPISLFLILSVPKGWFGRSHGFSLIQKLPYLSPSNFTSGSISLNSLASNMLAGLSLWISNELITLTWALTMHCLNYADTERTPRNVSEYNSCKINLWPPWESQIPLDQWNPGVSFWLIANSILWLSWEGKKKWWCFHAHFGRKPLKGENPLTKGNKQSFVFINAFQEYLRVL